jgi:hypothetical protein
MVAGNDELRLREFVEKRSCGFELSRSCPLREIAGANNEMRLERCYTLDQPFGDQFVGGSKMKI